MTKYKHLPTGVIWNKTSEFGYTDKIEHFIPASIVEAASSKDWEKVEEQDKDYEILEAYDHKMYIGGNHPIEIKRVLRKSDNQEFKIGDKFRERLNVDEYTINGFTKTESELGVISGNLMIKLSRIILVPEKPVLFTTEDGVKIREGEIFCLVDKSDMSDIIDSVGDLESYNGKKTSFLRFSTRESAESYVINNKPVWSFSEIWSNDVWEKNLMENKTREKCGFKKKEYVK